MEKSIFIHPLVREYTLVIAIDFGTTRSGFVYSFIDHGVEEMSSSNIHNFDDWSIIHNDQRIPSYSKDRTELLYDRNSIKDWGWGARFKNTTPDQILLKWFKLKLQTEAASFSEKGVNYDTVTVIADYLRFMKETALKFIHNDLSYKIPDERILWCLTIPAIWNDLAVDRMKRAAVKASMVKEEEQEVRLLLVREPEAAAVHCYFNMLNTTLEPGQTFMVIDAGGGTIDLTSYRVSPGKKLEELAKSSGGSNGSSFVDRNFFLYLSSLGLDYRKADEDNKLLDLQIGFENLKHATASEELNCTMELRNLSYFYKNQGQFVRKLAEIQNGEDDAIVLSPQVIKQLFHPDENGPYPEFHPVFQGVKSNIQEHIESLRVKGITRLDNVFLVGGFNRSPFLRKFIIENFKGIVGNDVTKFIKPLRPEQAIMEGACIYGINPGIIHSRIAKLTYGVNYLMKYDPVIHKGQPHKIFEGIDYCLNKFGIMCRKNESIAFDHYVSALRVPAEKTQQAMDITIFCSDSENPQYTDDKGVKKLAEVHVPLPGYGLEREVNIRFYFGKSDIKIEVENMQTHETKQLSIKFSSSFG